MKKILYLISLSCVIGCGTKKSECPFEGAECPNAQDYMREYQLVIEMDSTHIYDGDRKVGSVPFENSKLDSVILKDNL